MARLWNNQTQGWEDVADTDAPAAFLSGTHAFGDGTYPLVAQDGTVVDVPASNLQAAFAGGARLALPAELEQLQKTEKYSGTASQIQTALEGVARGASGGLSDLALPAVGLTTKEDIAARKEVNPTTALISEVGGTLAPGGALSWVGRGGRALGSMAAKTATGKIAQAAIEHGVGSAIEGAFLAGAESVSEAALGDPELTAQKVVARVGAGALLGGLLGVGLGGGGTALAEGLSAGRKKALEALAGKDQTLETLADKLAYRSLNGGAGQLGKIGSKRAQQAGRVMREELGPGFGTKSLEENLSQLRSLKEQAGSDIGKIYEQMDAAKVGAPDLEGILRRIDDEVLIPLRESPAMRNVAAGVEREVLPFREDLLAGRTPTWSEAHTWRSDWDKKVKFAASNVDPGQKALADIRRIMSDELEAGAEQTGALLGEDVVTRLRTANQRYTALSDLTAAGGQGLKRAESNNIFGLNSFISGVAGASVGGLPGAAMGFFGREVLRRYGTQASAELLGRVNTLVALERSAQRVDQKLARAAERLSADGSFAGSEKIAASTGAGRDVQKQISAARAEGEQIRAISADPDALAGLLARKIGAAADHAPQTAQQMSQMLIKTLRFLSDKAPTQVATMPALGLYDPMTVSDLDRWQRYKTAALDPMRAVANITRGRPSPEEIETLKALYPSLAQQLQENTLKELAKRKTPLPPEKMQLVGQLLGVGSIPERKAGFVRLMQKSYAPPAQKQQASGSGGIKKISENLQTTGRRIGR